MTTIETAIRHAVQAGRLRDYVRNNGEAGLGGLLRLADRNSRLATAALGEVGTAAMAPAPPFTAQTWGLAAR